jgi:hypothetical protein
VELSVRTRYGRDFYGKSLAAILAEAALSIARHGLVAGTRCPWVTGSEWNMRLETCVADRAIASESSFVRELIASIGTTYCQLFHDDISRPVNGKYRCWKCLREFETDFENG